MNLQRPPIGLALVLSVAACSIEKPGRFSDRGDVRDVTYDTGTSDGAPRDRGVAFDDDTMFGDGDVTNDAGADTVELDVAEARDRSDTSEAPAEDDGSTGMDAGLYQDAVVMRDASTGVDVGGDTVTADVPITCLPWQRNCAGRCVDLFVDSRNCGACGAACAAGMTCSRGVCTVACAPNSILCGSNCLNILRDPENCGACGVLCRQVCNNGRCATPTEVYAEGNTSCARFDDETVRCWGANGNGQLGDGTTVDRVTPVEVAGVSGATGMSMAKEHSCVTHRSGAASCWGRLHSYQLGDDLVTRSGAAPVRNLPPISLIRTGANHTCAIERDGGRVFCWGFIEGLSAPGRPPQAVPGVLGAVDLGVVLSGTCIGASDGLVRCLGQPQTTLNGASGSGWDPTLRVVGGVTDATAIVASADWLCARGGDGVRCWGQVPPPYIVPTPPRTAAAVIAGSANVTHFDPGDYHLCGVNLSGSVQCWGSNNTGQIDPLSVTGSDGSGLVPTVRDAVGVAAGERHTCVLTRMGDVYCLGSNQYGQLGALPLPVQRTPVQHPTLREVSSLSAGYGSACAVFRDGSVSCWGANAEGGLGDGTRTRRTSPVRVLGLAGPVASVVPGSQHTCARLVDQTVQCWGWNSRAQLGDGTFTSRLSPTFVPGLRDVVEIGAGWDFTCARSVGGAVRCWGYNYYGQLGSGTSGAERTAPVTVTGLPPADQLAVSYSSSCARAGGRVWCWGVGTGGQLGDGLSMSSAVPVAVSGVTSAVDISVGGGAACAVLADGSVQCWGGGASLRSALPFSLPGITNALRVSAGTERICALLRDRRVVCWGTPLLGARGDGALDSDPVGVGSPLALMDAVQVEAAAGGAYVLRADGVVFYWGNDPTGWFGTGVSLTPRMVQWRSP